MNRVDVWDDWPCCWYRKMSISYRAFTFLVSGEEERKWQIGGDKRCFLSLNNAYTHILWCFFFHRFYVWSHTTHRHKPHIHTDKEGDLEHQHGYVTVNFPLHQSAWLQLPWPQQLVVLGFCGPAPAPPPQLFFFSQFSHQSTHKLTKFLS